MGIFLIWKQRRSKGNRAVREPRLGGSETAAPLGKGREGVDRDTAVSHRLKTLCTGWEEPAEPRSGTSFAERIKETPEGSWAEL